MPGAAQANRQARTAISESKTWNTPWERTRPRDPYADQQGRVWFVGQTGNYIGRLDPRNGEFNRYEIDPGTNPHNLVVDRKGMVWITGNANGRIVRLDPATGKLTTYPMPDPVVRDLGSISSAPTSSAPSIPRAASSRRTRCRTSAPARVIAITSDDAVWYGDYTRGYLGRLDPATGKVEEFQLPGGLGSLPYAMTLDDRGRIWVAETGVQPNRLVAFDPTVRKFTETIPIAADAPNTIRHMTFDAATRQIWFGGDANMIGRVQVSAAPMVP